MRRWVIGCSFIVVFVLGADQRASADPIYADWTLDASGNFGTGTFNGVGGMPGFSFTITGDHISDSTAIDDNDVFDNVEWESRFGEGDDQESLRVKSSGEDGDDNDLMTVSTITISFDSAVSARTRWAFAVTDLEGEDAVISARLGGSVVGYDTLADWFQGRFDSKPGDETHLPSGYDEDSGAVVAEYDSDGLLSDEILDPDGTESASGWFLPDTAIDTLVLSHRNRFGGGASMHVYMAVSEVPEPSTVVLFAMGLLGFAGIGARRRRRRLASKQG